MPISGMVAPSSSRLASTQASHSLPTLPPQTEHSELTRYAFIPSHPRHSSFLPTDQSVPLLFFPHIAHLSPVTYIDNRGQRVSTEAAYLTPEVLARPNLKVVTGARVTKIIFDSSSGTLRAVAVEFANSKQHAPVLRATARKEIIVWYVSHPSIVTPSLNPPQRRSSSYSPNPHALWYRSCISPQKTRHSRRRRLPRRGC